MFPECDPPTESVRLLAAACICMLLHQNLHILMTFLIVSISFLGLLTFGILNKNKSKLILNYYFI